MSLFQEGLSNGMGVSKEAFGLVGGAIFSLGALAKSIKKVPQGSVGIRTSFEKVKFKNGKPRIVKSGAHMTMPFAHSIEIVDVRARAVDLARLIIDRDEGQYAIDSSITWQISTEDDMHPYTARYEIGGGANGEPYEAVTNRCSSALRTVMESIDTPLLREEKVIDRQVKDLCAEDLTEQCGVDLIGVHLIGIFLTPAEKLSRNPASTRIINGSLLIPELIDGLDI
jgi:regulator of protease activity HflC (stomatin/prohibitin superfamily)